MKYTDEQIDLFLDKMGVELLPGQREMFKRIVNEEGQVYYYPARQMGRAHMITILNAFMNEVKEK